MTRTGDGYTAARVPDPQKQTAHLVALTSLIKSVPKSTYAHEMRTVSRVPASPSRLLPHQLTRAQLMPLLLRGLDLPDTDIRANVIDTLLAAAHADVDADAKHAKEGSVVAEHAASLTATMLRNTLAASMPSAVRASASLRAPECTRGRR